MATYTYETSRDEESALDLEMAKINGQLAAQNKPPLDKRSIFNLIVTDKFKPLAQQFLLAQVSPVVQKYLDSDDATRVKILESVATADVAVIK